MLGDRRRAGMIKNQRRRQTHPGLGGQTVAQFQRGQRIDPQILKRPLAIQGGRIGMSQHRGGRLDHQPGQHLTPLLRGQTGQPRDQRLRARTGRRLRPRGDQRGQDRRHPVLAGLTGQGTLLIGAATKAGWCWANAASNMTLPCSAVIGASPPPAVIRA